MKKLGRLEKVDPRSIWQTEDMDFTPWLAQEHNISLLGETLGLELEVEAQEKRVGPFSADILCKDVGTDSWVLIENQLERTDHKHLGQLLTYSAGLNAVTIIWIASRFNDEHRATLDWLNKITDEDFRFFGLEVELWRIGDSEPAPKFNIISKPNSWSKQAGQAARRLENEPTTDVKKSQLEFWELFSQRLDKHPVLRTQKPRPQHWINIAIGRAGMRLGGLINSPKSMFGIELYMNDDNAKSYFYELKAQQDLIQEELGFKLDWQELPEKTACRLIYNLHNAPLSDKNRWPEYLDWMEKTLFAFDKAFRQRVRTLSGEFAQPAGQDEEISTNSSAYPGEQ